MVMLINRLQISGSLFPLPNRVRLSFRVFKVIKKIPYILLLILIITCWGIGFRPGGDLNVYYQASIWLQKGWVTRLYFDNAEIGNFFYGPFGLSLLKPLSLLSFSAANILWLFLQTGSYVIFWFFIFKIFPEILVPKNIKLFLLVWIVSIKPIHASFQSHNVQLMFAAILVAAEWGSRSKVKTTQVISGVLISLCASIKIYPAFIAIYYLLRRPSTVKAGLILGGLISLVVPLFVFGFAEGVSLPAQFVENALHYNRVYDLAKDTVSLSLPSLLTTWLPPYWVSYGAVIFITGTSSLLFFIWAFLTRQEDELLNERHFWAFLWSMMALLNSTTRPDYFIYFLPAFASLGVLIQTQPKKIVYRYGILVSVLLISFITEWVLGSRDLTHYLEGLRIPVLGIMTLCLMQFMALRTVSKVPKDVRQIGN